MNSNTYIKSFLVISVSFSLSSNSDQSRTVKFFDEFNQKKILITSKGNDENAMNKIELKIMLGQPAPRYYNCSENEDWERFLKESNNQSFNGLFCLCKKRELSGPKAVTDNTHNSYRNSCNDSGAGLEMEKSAQHKWRSKTDIGYDNQKPLESCEAENMEYLRVLVPFNINYNRINPRT